MSTAVAPASVEDKPVVNTAAAAAAVTDADTPVVPAAPAPSAAPSQPKVVEATTIMHGGKDFGVGPSGFVIKKLFTHEDPQYVHKTFGLLAILSFIYRYIIVRPKEGTLGFDGTLRDWVTFAMHLILSFSSVIFHVLPRRNINRPMIIWKEYQLHAMVFTFRCFAVYLLSLWCPAEQAAAVHLIVFFAHSVVVDYITAKHGEADSTTVRVKDDSVSPLMNFGKRAYAFYQFLASAAHIIPHPRSGDLGWNSLVAIQSSAFLMTLFRKGLILPRTHMIVYSACLVLSSYHILISFPADFILRVLFVFLLRTRLGVSKYIVWTWFALIGMTPVMELLDSLQPLLKFLPSSAAFSFPSHN